MPEITIQADNAQAVIDPDKGGWLLRYARELEGHGLVEALHCAKESVARYPKGIYAGNPVLFPLVAKNRAGDRDHWYEWNGRQYEMPQHGFARRLPWTVVEQRPASVTMELKDSEATRANYPFAFRQRLSYRIDKGRLHWEQVIENQSDEPMPFSTGFHPYFNVPLSSRSEREACYVELPDCRRLKPQGDMERFTSEAFPAQNWSVDQDVAGTMFLADLASRELVLVDPPGELEVVLNMEDAPQFRFVALWARSPQEPFYCIEPWTALPNAFTRVKDHELTLLDPRQTFRAAFWLEVRKMA